MNESEKEAIIDQIRIYTESLNQRIKEAWELGLSIDVTTHTDKIQVNVKEIE